MGARGPIGEPTSLRLAKGRLPANHRGNEPLPAEIPADHVPEDVLVCDRAARLWREIVPAMAACGLARMTDTLGLARYVIKFARWLDLWDQLRALGTDKPADAEALERRWLRLDEQLRKDERTLGLNPGARSRMTVPEAAGARQPTFFDRRANYRMHDENEAG